MSKELTIRQPYRITTMRYKFSVTEMRILFRIIESLQPQMVDKVQKSDLEETKLVFRTKDLLRVGDQNHTRVKEALSDLTKKTIEIQGENKNGKFIQYTGLIMKSRYFQNNERVEVVIDSLVVQEFLDMAKGFTRYLIDIAFNFESEYTMKFYQLINHWKDIKVKYLPLQEFREWLHLEEKYPKVKELNRRVLEPMKKELKEKGDVWFDHKNKKEGRQIVGFYLHIKQRKEEAEKIQQNEYMERQIVTLLKTYFYLEREHLDNLKRITGDNSLHKRVLLKIQNLYEHIKTKKINGVQAYVTKSILNEFEKNKWKEKN